MKKFPWLHYSKFEYVAFCRACAIFAPDSIRGQALKQFVTQPFKMWIRGLEKIREHALLEYHLTAIAKRQAFKSTYENPSRAIDTAFDKEIRSRMHDNQIILESLFRIVMLCGKQGFALRGHRDDKINWEEYSGNLGNFLELVHFRAETDEVLRKHLQYGPKNANTPQRLYRMSSLVL